MSKVTIDTTIQLQQLLTEFAMINRRHYLPKSDRRENDAEHSLSVAILCWYIYDTQNLDLNLSKILKYALAHDIVEIYAGDTNTYASIEERKLKTIRERAALEKIAADLGGFPSFAATIEAYESKTDEESRFVWTVDKMQMLLLGHLDHWRAYREQDISYEAFHAKQTEHLEQASPYARSVFEALVKFCLSSYQR